MIVFKFKIDFISATRYDYAFFLSVKTEKHVVRSKKKICKVCVARNENCTSLELQPLNCSLLKCSS